MLRKTNTVSSKATIISPDGLTTSRTGSSTNLPSNQLSMTTSSWLKTMTKRDNSELEDPLTAAHIAEGIGDPGGAMSDASVSTEESLVEDMLSYVTGDTSSSLATSGTTTDVTGLGDIHTSDGTTDTTRPSESIGTTMSDQFALSDSSAEDPVTPEDTESGTSEEEDTPVDTEESSGLGDIEDEPDLGPCIRLCF